MTETPTIRMAGAADAPAVALLVHRLLGTLLPPEKVTPLARLEATSAWRPGEDMLHGLPCIQNSESSQLGGAE